MRADSGLALSELRVDGGASTNDLLMQIQADVAGVRVVRAAVPETTALGAAYLAGLPASWKADRVFEPRIDDDERASRLNAWRDAVKRVR
jgi:glycerol kinase